jgi:para-aminobenzoate synthetase/4-amino-4-deoxychorismate lyase
MTPHAPDQAPDTPFSLVETIRLENGSLVRLERHLARMRASATALLYSWREDQVRAALSAQCSSAPTGTWRVRLLVDQEGYPSVTCTAHLDSATPWRVAFANAPVDARDPRLLHKTTNRVPYEVARRSRPDVDDVVLWNERGEVTESTIANIVADIGGVKCTPPVSSGLLAGVLRAELLDAGQLTERVITRGMLARAERVWLINSLRGWIDAALIR